LYENIKERAAHKHDFKDSLKLIHIIAYSAGHFANDLTILISQSFLPLYFIGVVKLDEDDAGMIMLVG